MLTSLVIQQTKMKVRSELWSLACFCQRSYRLFSDSCSEEALYRHLKALWLFISSLFFRHSFSPTIWWKLGQPGAIPPPGHLFLMAKTFINPEWRNGALIFYTWRVRIFTRLHVVGHWQVDLQGHAKSGVGFSVNGFGGYTWLCVSFQWFLPRRRPLLRSRCMRSSSYGLQ